MSGRIFRAGGRDFNRKICLVPHKSPMCRRCAFHCSNGVRQKCWRIGQSVKTSVHSYINHRISFKLSIHISLAQATISAQDQEIQSVKSRCFKATHPSSKHHGLPQRYPIQLKPRLPKKTTQPTNKIKYRPPTAPPSKKIPWIISPNIPIYPHN